MRWLAVVLLTLALSLPTGLGSVALPVAASSCSHYDSRTTPPKTIRVFRAHHRGSTVKARVELWNFKKYVGSVMASGAWPNRPRESAKVGAIAIKQYAWWMILNHQPGHSWHGQCYDITDSEQYLKDVHVPVRTASAVSVTWGVSLRKGGRFFRTGWSGGLQYDHWHLGEDATRKAAQWGWGWRRIIHTFLSPVEIRA